MKAANDFETNQRTSGLTIGLLGGSFDPPHAGHVHITRWALRLLDLDQVWWLVAVGNPLKERQPAPLAARMTEASKVMRHPRVIVSDLEERLGTRRTATTIEKLKGKFPATNFVWLMGSDNLVEVHRWERWRAIFEQVPVAVLFRPTCRASAFSSIASRVHSRSYVARNKARLLPGMKPPAWTLLSIPLHSASSSALRSGS